MSSNEVEVVISGIGGTYPNSPNVEEFADRLMKNEFLIQLDETRWKGGFGVKPYMGLASDYRAFDRSFFGVHFQLSFWTSPVYRLCLERVMEAIIDAGVSPDDLRGSKTNCYDFASLHEFEQQFVETAADAGGYTIMGICRAMSPNRVSYFFDFKGHSCSHDGSDASCQLGLELASRAIRNGECENAFVIAGNVACSLELVVQLQRLGLISDDGITRCFDKNASGSTRSDSVVCFMLQRADRAKRCYAKVLSSLCQTTGVKNSLDVSTPSIDGMKTVLNEVYRRCGADPSKVVYLEADGRGKKIWEEAELQATQEVLGVSRAADNPLLIGSVKSNVGQTDVASGLVAVSKLIIAMESGVIPATINFNEPNPNIQPLADGTMKVVSKNTPVTINEDTLFAATNLGLAGQVGHVILKPNLKEKKPADPSLHTPRLVVLSGRTLEGVDAALDKILASPFDPEYLRLVQDAFSPTIRMHIHRGFTIVPPVDPAAPIKVVDMPSKQPLVFVYSGMGSQWGGMGTDLLAFPIFAETIDRLHKVLEKKGVDLKTIITDESKDAFDNILKSFVGITAIQVAMTNMLRAMELKPYAVIGHSTGELACAYADACFTEEQVILAAYERGVASNEAELITGMMAAVGIGYENIKNRLPETIDVACHNSSTSTTLSGPAEDVQNFVAQLTEEGVFARTVNVSDIAYHSRYIQPAAPYLKKALLKVITEPKLRSSSWISTSVPEDKWDTPDAKYCSAEYFTNNLLNPVLFEESMKHTPKNAVYLEIAPHGLMQAILTRELPNNLHLSLATRKKPPAQTLLPTIGKLYTKGYAPKVSTLYPDIEFPVSRGTPSLASLVTWDHSERKTAGDLKSQRNSEVRVVVDSTTPLLGMADKLYCPVSQLILAVWKTWAFILNTKIESLALSFTDLRILKIPEIPVEGSVELVSTISRGSGNFEVTQASLETTFDTLIKGNVRVLENEAAIPSRLEHVRKNSVWDTIIQGSALYEEIEVAGLRNPEQNRAISNVKIGPNSMMATVQSTESPAVLLESAIQLSLMALMEDHLSLGFCEQIRRLDIYPATALASTETSIYFDRVTGFVDAVGLHIEGVKFGTLDGRGTTFNKLTPTPSIEQVVLPDIIGELSENSRVVSLVRHYQGYQGRQMGVARNLSKRARPVLDPQLTFPVPRDWTDSEAATVPLAYCKAYYVFKVLSKASRGDAVLIHEGLTPLGQACVRVARSIGCHPIFVTVRSEKDKQQLLDIFPNFPVEDVILVKNFEYHVKYRMPRLKFGNRVQGIMVGVGAVTGEEFYASTRCMACWGTYFHFAASEMAGTTMGLRVFINSTAVFGLSEEFLFKMRDHHKKAVIEGFKAGLASGVVQPPDVDYNNNDTSKCEEAQVVLTRPVDAKNCTPDHSYLVVGGAPLQWLNVVSWLTLNGARSIVVGRQATKDINQDIEDLVQHRILQIAAVHGTEVHVEEVNDVSATSTSKLVQLASLRAPLDVVVVFQDHAEEVLKVISGEAGVIVMDTDTQSHGHDYGRLEKLCKERRAAGALASVVVGPVCQATELIPKLIENAIPAVNVLIENDGAGQPLEEYLPCSLKDLVELRIPEEVVLKQVVPWRSPRRCNDGEVFPTVAIPPLGALQPSVRRELDAFALNAMAPVFYVELPTSLTGVEEQAEAIVRVVRQHLPRGPYNILGWGLSTPIAMQVAHLLHTIGQRTSTFLLDGDLQAVSSFAAAMTTGKDGARWLQKIMAQDVSVPLPPGCNCWPDVVPQLVPRLPVAQAPLADRALQFLGSRLQGLAAHDSKQSSYGHAGRLIVLRRSNKAPVSTTNVNQLVIRTVSPSLADADVATVFNDEAAWSGIASYENVREKVFKFARLCPTPN